MAIAKTRVHIICGLCGSNEFMNYSVERDANIHNEAEDNEYTTDAVILACDNCGSITYLDELMNEDTED